MFRSADRTLSDGLSVPNGEFGTGNIYAGSPLAGEKFSKQIIDSLRLAQTEVTVIPTAGISVGTNPVRQLHVGQAVGQSGPMVDELLGNRGLHEQRRPSYITSDVAAFHELITSSAEKAPDRRYMSGARMTSSCLTAANAEASTWAPRVATISA